jgi:hypothetical protein
LADKYESWSPYNYTLNNPASLIDPDGREVYHGEEAQAAFRYLKANNFFQRPDPQPQRERRAGSGTANSEALALGALLGCPPTCSVTAWDNLTHVIKDHLLRGTPSQFRDMSHEALKKVIDVTVRRFDGMVRQASGNLVFERVWKGGIGKGGEQIVRVVTTATGELVTAFPVKNPMVLRAGGAVAGAGFTRFGKFARTAVGGAILGAGVWLITSPTPTACQAVHGC